MLLIWFAIGCLFICIELGFISEIKKTRFVGALRAPPRSLRRPNKRCIFVIGISLTKAFPVAQICPNLHKIVSSSACCWERFYASLDKSVLQGMLL